MESIKWLANAGKQEKTGSIGEYFSFIRLKRGTLLELLDVCELSRIDEKRIRRESDHNILYKCVIKPSPKMLYIYCACRQRKSEYDDVSCNIYILGRLIFSVP